MRTFLQAFQQQLRDRSFYLARPSTASDLRYEIRKPTFSFVAQPSTAYKLPTNCHWTVSFQESLSFVLYLHRCCIPTSFFIVVVVLCFGSFRVLVSRVRTLLPVTFRLIRDTLDTSAIALQQNSEPELGTSPPVAIHNLHKTWKTQTTITLQLLEQIRQALPIWKANN